MTFLYIDEDGELNEIETIEQDHLGAIDAGLGEVLRFENGHFESARAEVEEKDEDDEDNNADAEDTYVLKGWGRV